MATRFYLPRGLEVLDIAPAPDVSWELTTGFFRRALLTQRRNGAFATAAITESSASTTYDVCIGQFISQPLLGAQTITGTVKGIIRALESSTAADMRAQILIKVVSGTGTTVRGTLLAHDASALSNEFDAAVLTNRKFPLNWSGAGATLTSVAALDGDRIVIEVGYRAHNTVTTIYGGTLEFGDASASDCAENETGTTQDNPWFEFSQTFKFYGQDTSISKRKEPKASQASNRRPLSGKSVSFDGVDGYVTMGNVLNFERTQSFTLSCWVKYASVGYLFNKQLGSPSYKGYEWYIYADGSSWFEMASDYGSGNYLGVRSAPSVVSDGAWHHVALVYNGDSLAANIAVYVDGVLTPKTVVTDALSASITTTRAFELGGCNIRPGNYFGGKLDGALVHDKALSAVEIAYLYSGLPPNGVGAPSNLVAWWKMGDGDTYPTLLDSGGSGYSGTMTLMSAGDIQGDSPPLPLLRDASYVQAGFIDLQHDADEVASVKRGQREPSITQLGAPSVVGRRGEYVRSQFVDLAHSAGGLISIRVPEPSSVTNVAGGGSAVVTYYKMRAQDSGVAPPGYVTWVVQGAPDFGGTDYAGGSPTPVGAMVGGSAVVAAEYTE